MDKNNPNMLPSEVIRVRTPQGTLFAIVVENHDGTINNFQLTIGKAGNDVAVWANAVAGLMNLVIQKGGTLEDLLTTLSGITSSRVARSIGSTCRSGPEGVWMALLRYKRGKFEQLSHNLGVEEDNYRGPTVAAWARTRNS